VLAHARPGNARGRGMDRGRRRSLRSRAHHMTKLNKIATTSATVSETKT
jgi:hypothetical protein